MGGWQTNVSRAGLTNASMEGLRDYVGQDEKLYYGMWCSSCQGGHNYSRRGTLVTVSRARIHLKKCPRCHGTRLFFDTIGSRQYEAHKGKNTGIYLKDKTVEDLGKD